MTASIRVVVLAVLLIAACVPRSARGQENLDVTAGWMKHTDLENALYRQFSREAYDLLDARRARIAALRGEGDWARRQAEVRGTLERLVGPFPEKTPLNARVMGTVEKNGYRIENVVFESRPRFYVTASVFVPNDLDGRAPAVVYASGHAADGYHGSTYRSICANLARKGFVVLAFDPLGQGERLQYLDAGTGASRIGVGVPEHSYAGAQGFVAGSSIDRYFIWDGIRAVDYLISRDDVDSERIGLTGRSGGGTQTALIAAVDERILAAAPENYITSQRRLFESIGPQDAEQNLYRGVANGIDHADLLVARAPRPTLIVATTNDYFSIQGARETFAEAEAAFEAFGRPGALRWAVDTAGHASTVQNRETLYAFFQDVLANPGDPGDRDVPELTEEDTRVTATGQVANSLGGETVFTLNRAVAERRMDELAERRTRGRVHVRAAIDAARELSGYRDPDRPAEPVYAGRHAREGYVVEKYFVQGEGDYVIPYLLVVPDGAGPFPAVVYLSPDGKAADAAVGGPIEGIVRGGYVVLAPDLVGTGETGLGRIEQDVYHLPMGDAAYNVWFAAAQVGRSIVGLRAGDVVRLAGLLERRPDVQAASIAGVAKGGMGAVLLHAAAFHPSLSEIVLVDPLVSYASFATSELYRPELIHATVPGALTAYDLPDLAAAAAPRPLTLVGVADAWGEPLEISQAETAYGVAFDEYARRGAEEAILILPASDARNTGALLGR